MKLKFYSISIIAVNKNFIKAKHFKAKHLINTFNSLLKFTIHEMVLKLNTPYLSWSCGALNFCRNNIGLGENCSQLSRQMITG